jgi:outer membrane lipoprotein-sorting protein
MKWASVIVLCGFVAAIVIAVQSSLPAVLLKHDLTLREAKGLSASFTVQPAGGAPEQCRLFYLKPDLLRIERPDSLVISDGKVLTRYDKVKNVYESSPLDGRALTTAASEDAVWAWSAFFSKEPAQGIRSAQAGAVRTLRGNQVTEVNVVLGGSREGSAVLYVDQKLGIARGFRIKVGTGEVLVMAGELSLSEPADAARLFSFVAPEGAKKAEDVKPVATFAEVQKLFARSCMPCHSPSQMSGGLNLSTHHGILMGVTPGNPDSSRIVRAIRSGAMPKGRSPLTKDEIALVEKWVQDGAKDQ